MQKRLWEWHVVRYWFIAVILLVSLVAACQPVGDEPLVASTTSAPGLTAVTDTPMPPPATALPFPSPSPASSATLPPVVSGLSVTAVPSRTTISGVWRTLGHGSLLRFSPDQVEWYEVTDASCLPAGSSSWDGESFLQGTGRITPLLENNRLVLTLSPTTIVYAEPLPALPDRCPANGTGISADPELNFELFWHTFNENYSLFEQYNVDWEAVYELYRPQITEDSSPAELFDVFTEMLAPLQDSHVRLVTNSRQYAPWVSPGWMSRPPDFRAVITEQYLDEGWQSGGQERLLWGTINGQIGYLSLHQLGAFTPNGENDHLYLPEAIDQIVTSFQGMQAIIIDVRMSNEGRPEHALTIASRLVDRRSLGYSVRTRDGLQFTDLEDFYIEPAGPRQFAAPIYLLVSGMTAGASELLVLCLGALPQVTVIGEPTAGSQSGLLTRRLPNGWTVELSNQLAYSPAGVVYESIGYPPDIAIPVEPAAYRSTDPMLEEVFRQVEDR